MPDPGHACARGYVSSPVTAESGVFLATRWAFTLDDTLSWDSIGIIVADPERGRPLSQLHRLRSRGIRIGTIDQALTTRSFCGVMIAYRPTLEVLARTQDLPGAVGVAVLAADPSDLQLWVDAYHPEHLGGEVITPTPDPPQTVLIRQVLASFTNRFTTRTGRLPPDDQRWPTEAIRQVHRHGYPYTPDSLMVTALRTGWPGDAAWALHQLAAIGPPHDPQAFGPRVRPPRPPQHPSRPDRQLHF